MGWERWYLNREGVSLLNDPHKSPGALNPKPTNFFGFLCVPDFLQGLLLKKPNLHGAFADWCFKGERESGSLKMLTYSPCRHPYFIASN